MKIEVNKDVCIGCGVCTALCPGIFELKGDMKSHVKDGDHSKEAPCADKAASSCPVGAISVKK